MRIRSLAITCLLLFSTASVEAQLFGPRNVGRNTRGARRTAPNAAGTVTEDRRFVRGSRTASDFVGTDKEAAAAFVGNTQAVNDGNVTSAVTGLREQPTMRVNRPLTVRRTGIYAPRVKIDFEVPTKVRSGPTAADPTTAGSAFPNSNTASRANVAGADLPQMSLALRQFVRRHSLQISPAPTERSVILSGTVPTEHDRRIAELLASFEPGLENVKNDLQVTQ